MARGTPLALQVTGRGVQAGVEHSPQILVFLVANWSHGNEPACELFFFFAELTLGKGIKDRSSDLEKRSESG